jgi:hypothetical protein
MRRKVALLRAMVEMVSRLVTCYGGDLNSGSTERLWVFKKKIRNQNHGRGRLYN